MGNCCKAAQEDHTLDPLEQPSVIEIQEFSRYTSSISSRINEDDLWRNKEEVVDN